MLRETLLEQALAVAVSKLQKVSKERNTFAPVLQPLQNVVDKTEDNRDVAMINYCFTHPEG